MNKNVERIHKSGGKVVRFVHAREKALTKKTS